MVSNIGPLRTLSYSMVSTVSSTGKQYVPVKPNQYVYSQFKHVSGFPAQGGQQGISVDRLVILNTLIDQLVSMKQKNAESAQAATSGMSDDQIDALIDQYQSQVQAATVAAETMDYKPVLPQTGMVINLVA